MMHPPATEPILDSLASCSTDQSQQVAALLEALAQRVPKQSEPKYLTVQDAAAYCRLAVQTIYNNRRYIKRMPGVRKLLFTREALDAWLATRPMARRKHT